MNKLRTMIEDYLYDDSAERPKIIKLVDDWLTNASTFVEDKVPTGSKTALISVSGARSSKSKSSSAKRILQAFTSSYDESKGEYVLSCLSIAMSAVSGLTCVTTRSSCGVALTLVESL